MKMKKLVMLLTLTFAVVSAKAACVDWSVNGTASLENQTVYLLTSAPGDYADVSALTAAAVGSATIASAGRGKYGTPKVTSEGANVTPSTEFYFAIVAADGQSFNYVAAVGMGARVYDPENQESSLGEFKGVTGANIVAGASKAFTGGGVTPGPGPGDIPEPTSGLLLVVGGALLALRRKQK